MEIRAATPDDNAELIKLQSKCPQGSTIIVSTVNTPDFFARARVYEDYRVYVVCQDNHIIASAACALRKVLINHKIEKIGHEFQAFVDPEYRGRRIAGQLHQIRQEYLVKQGAALSYGLIIEGNKPSMRHVERAGFRPYRTLVMPSIAVFKEMNITHKDRIRSSVPEDLPVVAGLVNDTWQGYEMYEPVTAEDYTELMARISGFSCDNIFVFEKNGEITACLGFWDWSRITQVRVKAYSLKMRALAFFLNGIRVFRPAPRIPKPDALLKQIVLTSIGFKDIACLKELLRYVNNKALSMGIEQIFFICERKHPLMACLKEYIHIDSAMQVYVKPLREGIVPGDKMVFINGLDL